MKISLEWLADIVGKKLEPNKTAEILSRHAFEAEPVRPQTFKGIVVAKVLEVNKHPNADKLRVVRLFDGKNEHYPVVCGAWNFEAGAIVPLGLPGAVIPHDQHDPEGKSFILSKATIRGVESAGMICSARELGLGEDGNGIMLLGNTYKLGNELSISSDHSLDCSIPANRSDLMSYNGIAFELCAAQGTKYKHVRPITNLSKFKSSEVKINILSKELCPIYTATKISGVKVGPSPSFIQKRLSASGLRPINNIVDITNYVMLLTGQPLHAFDAGKVHKAIIVRTSKNGERLHALDGQTYEPSKEVLMIADENGPLAVAGIIGGMASSVIDTTTNIILESANFDGPSIRRASRILGIRTESSARFERGLPKFLAVNAAQIACDMILDIAGGKIVSFAAAPPLKQTKLAPIKFSEQTINSLLGADIKFAQQKSALENFGYKVLGNAKNAQAIPPLWREDVRIWEDLAEDIARNLGFEKIEEQPFSCLPSLSLNSRQSDFTTKLSDVLVRLGYYETFNYSFITHDDAAKWGLEKNSLVGVENPLNKEQVFMRPALRINCLKSAQYNSKIKKSFKSFEFGNTFALKGGKINESYKLCLAIFTKNSGEIMLNNDLRALFASIGANYKLIKKQNNVFAIFYEKYEVGSLTAYEDDLSKVFFAELDMESLMTCETQLQYKPIAKYPAVTYDFSFFVDSKATWSDIREYLDRQKTTFLESFEFKDAYRDNKNPQQKSLTISFKFRSPEKTLTEQEVKSDFEKISANLLNQFNGKARS
jgi:phenylalanyl-tRNA synthetase beta chain